MKAIRRSSRRAFATLLVLWAATIASLVLVALEATAWRQAVAGREAVARVRAKWAARAGIEATIARLESDTLNPDPSSAFTIQDDMAQVASAGLLNASYSIQHFQDNQVRDGPADAHAKLNINLVTKDDLMAVPDMTEDIADSILDWIDADDDTRDLGAESGFYLSLKHPYPPRNGPMRTIQELELVAGVHVESVRGEDWNLNGRLDPNEDDGDASWPPDNADGKLDAGWSAIFTASSVDGGLAASGQPRLNLRTATSSDAAQRLGLDSAQADALVAYAAQSTSTMADLIRTDLPALAPAANPGGGGQAFSAAAPIQPLTRDQLRLLLDETTIDDPAAAATGPRPGRLNINTCASDILQYLPAIDPGLADVLILERDGRAGGFTSLIDLLDVPAITRDRLAALLPILDVRSNVYILSCRGVDASTGMQVEIVATLDRSTLPVVIKDLVTR